MRKWICAGAALVAVLSAAAQPRGTATVSGYITDLSSSETLIGAGVLLDNGARVPVGAVTNPYGYYTLTIPKGDDEGRLISEEYYDELDHPAPSREGFAAHYVTYAESGHVASESYKDVNGQPMNVGGFSNVPRPTYQQPRPNPYPRQTYHRPSGSDVLSEMLTGMVLSSMLDSLSQTSQTTVTTSKPTSTLRGYRLVEDVVPLNSPIYCIGELYHAGTDVYIGRSVATEYPSSYFATRPEAEVIAALS